MNDPYKRAGTWRPTGINDANIVAMVANPRDLVAGVNDPVSPAQISAAAVRRLLTDNVKALPSSAVGEISVQSAGAAPAGAAAASGSGQ